MIYSDINDTLNQTNYMYMNMTNKLDFPFKLQEQTKNGFSETTCIMHQTLIMTFDLSKRN